MPLQAAVQEVLEGSSLSVRVLHAAVLQETTRPHRSREVVLWEALPLTAAVWGDGPCHWAAPELGNPIPLLVCRR